MKRTTLTIKVGGRTFKSVAAAKRFSAGKKSLTVKVR